MTLFDNLLLRSWQIRSIDGELCVDQQALDLFLAAPTDLLPDFEGPPNYELKNRGRGKDHPRYGRFVYSLARHYRPDLIVEVGSFAGGTAVGFASALRENGGGKLICVDHDTYSKGTFPEVTRRNLQRTGIPDSQFELCAADSREWLPKAERDLGGKVDIVLIDGDHRYEGALADITDALPLLRPGGLMLVHDVDRNRRMDEATAHHPHPVYEAFHRVIAEHGVPWCILKFIRKHLGVIRRANVESSSNARNAA